MKSNKVFQSPASASLAPIFKESEMNLESKNLVDNIENQGRNYGVSVPSMRIRISDPKLKHCTYHGCVKAYKYKS